MPSGAAWLQILGRGDGRPETWAQSVIPTCGLLGTVYNTRQSDCIILTAPLEIKMARGRRGQWGCVPEVE